MDMREFPENLEALFVSLEGRRMKGFRGGEKYRGKLENLSHFLKEYFFRK